MLTALSISNLNEGFSPIGVTMLIESCPHLAYLLLQTSPWTVSELASFAAYFSRPPSTSSRLSLHRKERRGGLCLQFLSLTLANKLSATERKELLHLAKKRFPALSTFETKCTQ